MRTFQTVIFGTSFKGNQGVGATLPTYSAEGGSIELSGVGSYARLAGSVDWAVGTGDFTVEWWQWQDSNSPPFPRVFSVGTYPSASIAVSIEGSTFIYWAANTAVVATVIANFTDQWIHFAVSRSSGVTKIFQNGQQLTSTADASNVTDAASSLTIGNESSTSSDASFKGYITNFRWTKGVAIYTSTFTPPAVPLTFDVNTSLLLLASNQAGVFTDSAGLHSVYSSFSASWLGVGPYSQRSYLDAGNPSSYTDPSATWLDLTTYQNNVSLTDITYNAAVGGFLDFGPTGVGAFATNPANQNCNTTPSAAITMWINVPNNGTLNYIAGVRNDTDFDFFFLMLGNGNTEARCHTLDGYWDINVSYSAYFNTWTHVCYTVNNTNAELYLNGVIQDSVAITGNFGESTSNFCLARHPFGGMQTANLKMSTLRYHTRARTSAEILAEFNSEKSRYGL